MTGTHPTRNRADLVTAARDGDLDAFSEIVRQERPSLITAARAILGDPHEAEDAAHEALVSAWRHLRELRDPASFGPWLSKILTRAALARRRRLALRHPAGDLATVGVASDERDPRLDRLLAEVTRLPEKYRVLLSLHYLRGHDYRETAAATGLPVKRVKSRLYEARALLRQRMGEEDER